MYFIFGLLIGSFLSAYTYRLPRKESVNKGRSKCPKCGKKIYWYDNIPLLSYLLLSGKCRNCGKRISVRYPIIEFGTAALFFKVIPQGFGLENLSSLWFIVFRLVVVTLLMAVMVIDFENQLIPDELVFLLISLAFVNLIITDNNQLFSYLFSGFAAGSFLLLLNLLTRGKGMGLGDAKLAIFGGLFLGPVKTVSWLFLSFVLGAAIGVILLFLGKAKFGKPVAFGPFLILSFYLMIFWGDKIIQVFFPYF